MKRRQRNSTIAVVGAGGVVGSHVTEHAGRMGKDAIEAVILMDGGEYQVADHEGENMWDRDVGRSKADVQARRLGRIAPWLEVDGIEDDVRNVPAGRLRDAIILCCVDQPGVRRYVSRTVCRLDRCWIDAQVNADKWLVTVEVYVPGPGAACVECAWEPGDDALWQEEERDATDGAATRGSAPSCLGALAASLQATELRKLLLGLSDAPPGAFRLVYDARGHTTNVDELRRNPWCSFSHEQWHRLNEGRANRNTPLADVMALRADGPSFSGPRVFSMAGHRFIAGLVCRDCHATRPLLKLQRRLSGRQMLCPVCRAPMLPSRTGMSERLEASDRRVRSRKRTLGTMGFKAGDVFTLEDENGKEQYVVAATRKRSVALAGSSDTTTGPDKLGVHTP